MKTKMNVMKGLCLVLFITQSILTYSQSYQDSLKKDDDDIISSIAPYPPDVRDAILNVSQYPQKIVKIERIQARTSQQFQDLIANYSRDEQLELYELSRYPDLVHELVTGPPKTLEQVKPTLTNYPKEVIDAVSNLYPMHLADLQSMDKTYQSSQSALHSVTEGLPSDAQADFKKIVAMPEVMNLLTERIDLVVSLGEAYKADPPGIKHKLDDLSAQMNEQNQKDLADYKGKVSSDPEMQKEMKKSAEEFADSYSANNDSTQNGQQKQAVVNNNYYYSTNYNPNPYPYWFGYPYWYAYPMWYPRPLYYYTGFYYGVGGGLVVVGLPSRLYSRWFFNYGYVRYPRYYGYCHTYYNTHRTMNVYRGFNTTVNNHFTRISTTRVNKEVNVNRNVHSRGNINPGNGNINHNRNSSPRINSGQFRNSINQPNNFNHQSYSNFHSNQFHQQSWGNMRGGNSGGSRPSGGFNGGGHMRGGGYGGGGHVGGGGHGRR